MPTPINFNASNQKGFAPVLLLLFVVLIAGLSFFAFQKYSTKPVSIQNPSTESTSPSNETASWKTYQSAKYGFEFKYPNNLSVRSDSTYESVGFLENPSENSTQKLIVSVSDNLQGISLKDYKEKNKPIPDDRLNVSYEGININSYDALKTQYELPCLGICAENKASRFVSVSIRGNKIIVSFSLQNNLNEGNGQEEERELNQILATFRFK
jgi:hypothetical protein